jgi:hypothetical protein
MASASKADLSLLNIYLLISLTVVNSISSAMHSVTAGTSLINLRQNYNLMCVTMSRNQGKFK